MKIHPAVEKEAIGWCKDCGLARGHKLTGKKAIEIVRRHYAGGLDAFLKETQALVA